MLTPSALKQVPGATVFSYNVTDPERYGLVAFEKGVATSIAEMPMAPKLVLPMTGLCFYDERDASYAEAPKLGPRGELQITDVNRIYMERGELEVAKFGRDVDWLDTGTPYSLIEATEFIRALEERQCIKVVSPEAVADHNDWISPEAVLKLAEAYKGDYGRYLRLLAAMVD